MKSKILNGLVVFLFTLFLSGVPRYVFAADEATEEITKDSDEIDQKAESAPEGHQMVETKIKNRFGINDETIQKLRDQKMGYGEITTTLALAQRMPGGINDENIKKITDLRTGDQKMGWGNIAKQFGVTMGDLHRSVKSVHSQVASNTDTQEQGATPPSQVGEGTQQHGKDWGGQNPGASGVSHGGGMGQGRGK